MWTGKCDEAVLGVIQGMFESNGEFREKSLLRWQYNGLLGGARVCIAHTDKGLFEEPVALYTVFPTRFRVGGKTGVSFQSFDTLTMSRYRGKGLFVRLAEQLYQTIASEGADVVYGIPNRSSVGGFVRYLNWSVHDRFPLLVRPIGLRYVRVRLGLRAPRIVNHQLKDLDDVRETVTPSSGSSDLYLRSPASGGMGVVRDFDYLSWRLGRPTSTYRILESVGKKSQLTGMIVFETASKHGCSVGYVMDLMVDRQYPAHADVLLSRAVEIMRDAGVDVILAWSLPSAAKELHFRRHGFHHLPDRLSPNKLHLGFRNLNCGSEISSSSWNFSYLDSDTV